MGLELSVHSALVKCVAPGQSINFADCENVSLFSVQSDFACFHPGKFGSFAKQDP